jgi:uncharacterized protein
MRQTWCEERGMTNRLASETSPYLLQHANNPVDWYPWGDDALTRSRIEDKPILLSIGYSACHWCHVMAHESFENKEIARLMNENFINIKVDREERPDLDTIYMEAVQSITGSGGWPLTVFLTPEGKPFYGGTYFPPEDGRGLPGFSTVLRTVSDAYRNRRKELEQATQQIIAVISSRGEGNVNPEPLTFDILDQAHSALSLEFDRVNGGFNQAPKFPQPTVLEFLQRHYLRTQEKEALHMVTLTLEKMARGGIYDQIGGGFHRYATDSHWLVPHFEKMLYDNALLTQLYLHAYLVTKMPLFRRIAEETIDYVLRDMTSPEGGFYSSQDADSEGQEGKYYVWGYDEIKKVLDETRSNITNDYYGVTERGNFEGLNILHVAGALHPEESGIIKQSRDKLLRERENRVKPGRDDKILASWNGLMLSSLAEAAVMLDRKDYLQAAVKNGLFLLDLMTSDGFLKRVYSHGQAKISGYLDDYALVADGLLNLHQATLTGQWLKEAIRLTKTIVKEFWDDAAGMFFDTSGRHQALFVRPKSTQDGALPSGSSAATQMLLKVAHITDDKRLDRIAERSLLTVREHMARYPLAFGNWLCALDFHLSNKKEIVIVGPSHDKTTAEMMRVLCNTWLPNKVIVGLDPSDPTSVAGLKLLNGKTMINGQTTVYVCEGFSCRTPVTTPDLLKNQIQTLSLDS